MRYFGGRKREVSGSEGLEKWSVGKEVSCVALIQCSGLLVMRVGNCK